MNKVESEIVTAYISELNQWDEGTLQFLCSQVIQRRKLEATLRGEKQARYLMHLYANSTTYLANHCGPEAWRIKEVLAEHSLLEEAT